MTISARQLGLTVTRMSGMDELVICPFHEDRNASAWFSPKKELFFCSVCGVGYNLRQLVKLLDIICEDIIDNDERDDEPVYNLIDDEAYILRGVKTYHPYFGQRGISQVVAERYGLRWDSSVEAAVLPITDAHGKENGCLLRYLYPEHHGTRYRFLGDTSAIWPMKFLPLDSYDNDMIVTEGGWSAMRLSTWIERIQQDWMPQFYVYSLLGAKANGIISQLLSYRKGSVIFLYDNDRAGRRACQKMRRLMPQAHCYTLSKSPDDMDDDEIEELLTKLNNRVLERRTVVEATLSDMQFKGSFGNVTIVDTRPKNIALPVSNYSFEKIDPNAKIEIPRTISWRMVNDEQWVAQDNET